MKSEIIIPIGKEAYKICVLKERRNMRCLKRPYKNDIIKSPG